MFEDIDPKDYEKWLKIYLEEDWAYAFDLQEFIYIMKNKKKAEELSERGKTI